MNERIIELKELNWGFSAGFPSVQTKPRSGTYGTSFTVDPFPCYNHDPKLVEYFAWEVEQDFPVGVLPNWYIAHYECDSRTNGCAGETYEKEPYIFLSGKRICIHPAMTRYLVAHEYGHVVNYWVQRESGMTDNQFDEWYADKRGIPCNQSYGSKNWDTNIGEVIANDFRICVAEAEREFWQHPYLYPDEKVRDLWNELKEKYAIKPTS